MHYTRKALVLFAVLLTITACDDNTGELGLYASSDGLSNTTEVYELTTRSMKMDSVIASSTVSYLGNIMDPETGTDIAAQFAAQFYTFENYDFPDKDLMVGEDSEKNTKLGIVQCDSCEIRLYFDTYYGDGNTPLKLEVYELSRDEKRIMSEDSTYYTDVDLTKFLPDDPKPIASRVFTALDHNVSTTTLNGTSYTKNIRIVLPTELGQRIMEEYYQDPNAFSDAYKFIHKVFPGLYFKVTNGKGLMLAIYAGTFNIFYRYADRYMEDESSPTIHEGLTRFAATPEVIQSTHFDNEDVDDLVSETDYTYLKTPAGICTEMTLPIDDIFSGEHASDSISMASVTLTRYNKEQETFQFGIPQELLMVRKGEWHEFFKKHKVADGRTSYTTAFNSVYNTYTFTNICRLISYCKQEYQEMDERHRKGEIDDKTWNEYLQDWDKVVLIPVTTSTNTSGALVSVTHDLGLGSIRLVGGNNKINMQVVYSKFNQ